MTSGLSRYRAIRAVSFNKIGVGGPGFGSDPPPSEPDRRISRIRLSSQWARLRDWLADALAVVIVNNPSFAKYSLVQS